MDHHWICGSENGWLDVVDGGETGEYPKKPCGPNVMFRPSVVRLERRRGGRRERGTKPPTPVRPLFGISGSKVGGARENSLVRGWILVVEHTLSDDTSDAVRTDDQVGRLY